MNKFLNLNRL